MSKKLQQNYLRKLSSRQLSALCGGGEEVIENGTVRQLSPFVGEQQTEKKVKTTNRVETISQTHMSIKETHSPA